MAPVSKSKMRRYCWTGLLIAVFVGLIVLFFYLDRRNELSEFIRAWGPYGVIFAIVLMAALCITPIPSEGLLVLYLKIYGIYQGVFWAWLGSTISAAVIFIIVRVYGQVFLKKLIISERFILVDEWVKRKGSLGLLVVRLFPIPAFALNFIASAMPSIKWWPYLWTAALSTLPYYVGTTLIFLGVAQETWLWLAVGLGAIILFWSLGYILRKSQRR